MSRVRLVLVAAASAAAAGCVGTPGIEGGPGAPPAPNAYWTPPASVREGGRAAPVAPPPAIADSLLGRLTLADAVDVALRNNPATRISWAQARASADLYGASRGALYPDLTLTGSLTRSRSIAVPGRLAGERTQYGPSLNLSYLVFDFGGRAGAIESARQVAIAAGLAHNTAVQGTILQVEASVFSYLATRALRDAQRTALAEATANLAAASDRHDVGLATIADVLQARTARSQAQLDLETLEGQLSVTRGALAVAMGLPANTTLDLPDEPAPDSAQIDGVTVSVDSLIDVATRNRPDLMEARAQARQAEAQLGQARAAGLPSLALTATGGHTASDLAGFAGNSYTLNLGLSIPLFTGFTNTYDVHAAQALAEAARARVELTRQQVALQVFTSYYAMRTAGQRVRTSADLLASATESEQVARGRYTEGVGSIVDLLVAQSALASARAQAVQARWQWRTALAQLAHDVGLLGIHGESLAPLTSTTPGPAR
ncbi:MAG: TolC family protein [Gemmatimonadota bacterium]|nr:TolC family protein [Gemmatimonadota bacterium]